MEAGCFPGVRVFSRKKSICWIEGSYSCAVFLHHKDIAQSRVSVFNCLEAFLSLPGGLSKILDLWPKGGGGTRYDFFDKQKLRPLLPKGITTASPPKKTLCIDLVADVDGLVSKRIQNVVSDPELEMILITKNL